MSARQALTVAEARPCGGDEMIATAIVVGLLLAAIAWLVMKIRFDAKN